LAIGFKRAHTGWAEVRQAGTGGAEGARRAVPAERQGRSVDKALAALAPANKSRHLAPPIHQLTTMGATRTTPLTNLRWSAGLFS
jgi:hypothetical protein